MMGRVTVRRPKIVRKVCTLSMSEIVNRKIAFIGNYLPRQCGIATFTTDVRNAVADRFPEVECFVVPMNDQPGGYDYPGEVRFEVPDEEKPAYRRAADFLNFSNTEVVSLQHEFGIFGGDGGAYIIDLLRALKMPIVTTLHTILPELLPEHQPVMEELLEVSTRLVVMSHQGQQFLEEIYNVSPDKIDFIPHGIPDLPFVDPNFYKDKFSAEGKYTVLTFGLLNPLKGIENVLQALPQVIADYPNLVYIVLGATHPALLRKEGDAYRDSLKDLVKQLQLEDHVIFYNRFVELEELIQYIGGADLYITPYLNREQITSGTLAYAAGCGKAVISTPYWYAEELLAEDRGILVPFKDPKAIADKMLYLLKNEPERHAMRKKAYLLGREMVWKKVAQLYMKSFQKARQMRDSEKSFTVPDFATNVPLQMPSISLKQLTRLTNSVGILHHSQLHLPNFSSGYHLKTNAQALRLMVLMDEMGQTTEKIKDLEDIYAAFLQYAFVPEEKHFRTRLNIQHQWLEEESSEVSQGYALWALGTCVGRSSYRSLQTWATRLFNQVSPVLGETQSPLACALMLLGVHEYFRQFTGDRLVNQLRETLTEKLLNHFRHRLVEGEPWFENEDPVDCARLPHALILSGRWSCNNEATEIGLQVLSELVESQVTEEHYFHPIASLEDMEQISTEQFPSQASAMVSACIEAYYATQEKHWLTNTRLIFEWFLGRNSLNQSLYDSQTGGCYDSLQVDRLNLNQGAEATVAFLIALVEVYNSFELPQPN